MGVKGGVKMGYERIDRDQRFDEYGDDVAVMRIAVHSNHSKRSNPATENSRKTTTDCGPLAPPWRSTIPPAAYGAPKPKADHLLWSSQRRRPDVHRAPVYQRRHIGYDFCIKERALDVTT